MSKNRRSFTPEHKEKAAKLVVELPGKAGDPAGAIAAFGALLADPLRVLDADRLTPERPGSASATGGEAGRF